MNDQQQQQGMVLHGVSDLKVMAEAIAKSGLFGIKTPEQGIALMLIAQAEGLHPAVAARDYDIIQGKPALKARAMQSRFQTSGGKVEWIERSDEAAEALFSHPQSPKPISIRWDMARAQKAGLGSKDNWRKFSRQMLSARVISEGVTACYPAATSGLYVPEEVSDFDDVKPRKAQAQEAKAEPARHVEAEVVKPEPIAPAPAPKEEPKAAPADLKLVKPEPTKQEPAKPKNTIAEDLAEIRRLAGEYGIKTREDYLQTISVLALIPTTIKEPTDLNPEQRQFAIAGLKKMLAEKGTESNG
jgi:hypothetical protein